MMRARFALASVVVMLLCVTSFVGEARTKIPAPKWLDIQNFYRVLDPGDAPPFVDSEYDKYRKVGTSSLSGRVVLHLSDNNPVYCQGQAGEEAYLFPNTAYTRWAIQKWVLNLDHQRKVGANAFPGYKGDPRIPMPDFLLPLNDNSILRYSLCFGDGGFRFENLPAGSYILVGEAQLISSTTTSTGPTVGTMITPYGLRGTLTNGEPIYGIDHGQGWVVVSTGSLDIGKGQNGVISDEVLRPVATFAP